MRKQSNAVGAGTRLGSRFTLLAIVGLQFAFLILMLLRANADGIAARTPLDRVESGVPAGTPLAIESVLPAATRRAQAWSPGAYLFAAAMQVDWPADPSGAASSELPAGGWVLLTFASEKEELGPEGRAATLSMLIDRMSGVVIDERDIGWTWGPRSLVATYPISSTVALFAADVSVGHTYRTLCPQFRHLSRVSLVQRDDTGGAYWLVTYEDARTSGRPDLEIQIDAVSGQVQRDDRSSDQLPC
jgi:hypothetical protein